MDYPDLTAGLTRLFSDFQSAWFLGVTTLCYLIIQVLRGKAGFQVPYITPWLDKQNKEIKTYAVIIFFALAGFFASFSADKVTVMSVLDGFLQGLAFGVGTVGTRNAIKQGIEGVQAYKDKNKTDSKSDINTDQNGSAQ
jgi:hypothetical protein